MQEEDKVFEKCGIFLESETIWMYFTIQDVSLLGRNNWILGELKNTLCFFIYLFIGMPYIMWGPCFPAKDHTWPLRWKHRVLTTRLPGSSLQFKSW